jgi:acylpyruvate hydrolase
MRIFAIGRNFPAHAKELNNAVPTSPVVFTKPDTALIKNNEPFYFPNFSKEIHYEVEVVLRIGKEGKNIDKKFAHKYIDAYALGIDFTARDLQDQLKAQALPWDIAKGFNGSAPISNFTEWNGETDLNNINFSLNINEKQVQVGNTADMLFKYDDILAYVSTYFTLRKGDYIYTGTPPGVGAIAVGDQLVGYLNGKEMLNFSIK